MYLSVCGHTDGLYVHIFLCMYVHLFTLHTLHIHLPIYTYTFSHINDAKTHNCTKHTGHYGLRVHRRVLFLIFIRSHRRRTKMEFQAACR
jgi:hypothetical protein